MKPEDIRRNRLRRAIDEARRFIWLANVALNSDEDVIGGGQHSAAAKRASMDLARALVAVRQSAYNKRLDDHET